MFALLYTSAFSAHIKMMSSMGFLNFPNILNIWLVASIRLGNSTKLCIEIAQKMKRDLLNRIPSVP